MVLKSLKEYAWSLNILIHAYWDEQVTTLYSSDKILNIYIKATQLSKVKYIKTLLM